MEGTARLGVTLLGDLQAYRGDVVLPVRGARLRAFLVRLALAGGRTVEPAVLIDAIWAEDPPADATHALQALATRLRAVLGSPGAVAQAAGGYRLAVEPDDVDALRFERLAAAGRDRLRAGDPDAAAAPLGDAVALWGDHPGTAPAAIATVAPAVATRLAHTSAEAVTDLAQAELSLGRADAAGDRLTALLAAQPLHEQAAALLMDALAAQGRPAQALAVYARVRGGLADTLGADPGTALTERHLRLLRAEPARPATAPPLPAPVTGFIGRDDDLARIDALLAAGRLVTVLGPGGAGKTRLAVEAVRGRGAWLADLAGVTEPAKVGAAVLAAIGLRGAPMFEARTRAGGDDLDVLADQLGDGRHLLLVDNCEHLIDAVAHLVSALLARCAGLRVLATSREPLAIDGEALVPLGPLPLPGPDDTVAQARRTASVRLFAQRAAAVRPGFAVDAHNLAEVLRVVRGLDGMPLALELAAARLRTLPLADLAAGLSDRFRLLTTGNRTALPRHRTLRAVIAWSWDLLDRDMRTVAERISVLPGGVTVASATAVCAGTAVPAAGIPDLLAGLVDRSLLQLTPDGGRYRMLETIREYGLGTAGQGRDLAARYFAGLVARHEPRLRGPGQRDALRVLRAEYDNVLAALRHLCDTGDATAALDLALGLVWFWQMLGRTSDAAHWLGEAVAVPGPASVARDLAGALLLLTGDAPVREPREELRALAGRDLPGFTGALITIRLAALTPTGASAALLQRFADGPDGWLAGLAHLLRAQTAEGEGRLGEARGDVTAALERFTQAGDSWGLATALPLRALLRQYDGDLAGALDDLTGAARLAGDFGLLGPGDEIFLDLRRIDLHVRLGDTARTTTLIAGTRERARHLASPALTTLIDALEAGLWIRLGDFDRARRLVGDLPAGGDHEQALIGAARAALRTELGDGPGAGEELGRAYAAAVASGDLPIIATVAVTTAGLAALHGRHREAAHLLGAAARLRGAHDHTDPLVRRLSDGARAALGEPGFAAAYDTGWRLDAPAALRATDPATLHRAAR